MCCENHLRAKGGSLQKLRETVGCSDRKVADLPLASPESIGSSAPKWVVGAARSSMPPSPQQEEGNVARNQLLWMRYQAPLDLQ